MKLYTALGISKNVKTKEGFRPVISVGSKVYLPNHAELVLWSLLLWDIWTYDQLEASYEKAMEEYHISEDVSFQWYLQHLEEAGLVASGEDVDEVNAYYDLIKNLVIVVPKRPGLIVKLFAFLNLVWVEHCPPKIAATVFKRPYCPDLQQRIVNIAREEAVTTAELVRYFETGGKGNVKDAIYIDGLTPGSVEIQSRFDTTRPATLAAVLDLHLSKQVIFVNK